MLYFVHHSGACKCSLECVPIKKRPSGTNWSGHTENVLVFLHIWEATKKREQNAERTSRVSVDKMIGLLCQTHRYLSESPSAQYHHDDSRLLLQNPEREAWVSGCLLAKRTSPKPFYIFFFLIMCT